MKKNFCAKFAAARRLFPVTDKKSGITYFNSAATGPLSKPVNQKMDLYYTSCFYLDKNDDEAAFADLDKIRKLSGRLIGARQNEIGFGFNTGYGLNIAAFGLPLKAGDEVLLSDIEFPSNVYPWLALKPRGVKIKFIKSINGFFDITNFEKTINRKTKVLSLSFVQFFNGYKNDLKNIGDICRRHKLYFVVDGIQGCGAETINVRKNHIDIFSSGAQKWLLSPLGTGFFYVRRELQEKINMPIGSWLSVDWKLKFGDLFHYDKPWFDSARRFELGTYPYGHVHAMAESLSLIDSLGIRNIQSHNHELIDSLIDFLKSDKRFQIVSSLEAKHRSSIISFSCREVGKVYSALIKRKILCAQREGAIRVAVHLYNNKADIEKLMTVLDRLTKQI